MQRSAEARPATRDQSGFTLLELVIVIILVILLFLAAWWRLLPLRGEAEAAHVATTIGTLRSALGLEIAERIVEDSSAGPAELDETNPMTLLAQAPGNYIGEVTSATDAEIPDGSWYFELESRELRYRVRFPQYLNDAAGEAPHELSWQISLSFHDVDDNGRFDEDVDVLRAIRLLALDKPGWSAPEENIPAVLEES